MAALAAAALTALTGAAALLGLSGPAAGSPTSGDDDISWSLDGEDFAEAPSGPLLPAEVWLNPGSVARAEVWIRNDASAARDLTVDLEVLETAFRHDELLADRALSVSARIGEADWRTRRVAVEPHTLVVGSVGSREAVRVEVRVAMSPEVRGRVAGSDLDLRVGLADAPDPGWVASLLPAESPLTSVLVPLGVLVVATGGLVVNRRDRRDLGGPLPLERRRPVTAIAVDDFAPSYQDALR